MSESEKEFQQKNNEDNEKDDYKQHYPHHELWKFLKNKSFPDKFIKNLVEKGATDEVKEVLEAYKFTCDELCFIYEELKKKKIKHLDSCDCSFQSDTDLTSRDSSVDANYLKEHFEKVLSTGLCEVIMKKPFDPIEYLGHWLLYYRECDEREKIRKEFEDELNLERLKYIVPSIIVESSDGGECEYSCQSTDDKCSDTTTD